MELWQIVVTATVTAAVFFWRPDGGVILGLSGWAVVAAVTAYKVRHWVRRRERETD